jgi:hypothetical protein
MEHKIERNILVHPGGEVDVEIYIDGQLYVELISTFVAQNNADVKNFSNAVFDTKEVITEDDYKFLKDKEVK